MSDRICSLTVVLRSDLRDDDAQPTIDAIKMIKGVVSVGDHVADPCLFIAKRQVAADVKAKIYDALDAALD